jgi:hypothetical protein
MVDMVVKVDNFGWDLVILKSIMVNKVIYPVINRRTCCLSMIASPFPIFTLADYIAALLLLSQRLSNHYY